MMLIVIQSYFGFEALNSKCDDVLRKYKNKGGIIIEDITQSLISNIRHNLPKMNSIKVFFKNSIPFFISRFASTFYQALNVIILGKIYGNSPIVGYYTSSDKVITLSKMASSPIADSLYPWLML